MRALCGRFLKDRTGATAIEYGLIIAVLSLAIVAGMGQAFEAIGDLWGSNDSKLQQAIN
jgi:pilus assembly protein Flp/PilA